MHLEKRILVTGGAGFLGSHLCDRLLAAGCDVVCVDNFFTGAKRNIEHLIGAKHFELMRHDVTFPLYVEVDEIYNFACPASPVHYQHDPVQTTKTSVHGAINMLGLAKRLGAKILQASTSEVYGDPRKLVEDGRERPGVHPQREDYWGHVNPIGPRSCYDEGKRCAETLFFDYWRQTALRIKVARIFNTYGPRMHPNDGRVVSNFIVQALLGRDITIYGDGAQTRSFCYVDDLIDGIIRLMGTPDPVTGPVNIGNPAEFSIRELAEITIGLTGSRSRIVSRPLPADDPRQRQPDISLARKVLDWAPHTALKDGLKRTIAYFEALLRDERVRGAIAADS
jgi:UDP-glucuronate decarboxylase